MAMEYRAAFNVAMPRGLSDLGDIDGPYVHCPLILLLLISCFNGEGQQFSGFFVSEQVFEFYSIFSTVRLNSDLETTVLGVFGGVFMGVGLSLVGQGQ